MPRKPSTTRQFLKAVAQSLGVSADVVIRYARGQGQTTGNARTWLEKLWHFLGGGSKGKTTGAKLNAKLDFKFDSGTLNALSGILANPEAREDLNSGGAIGEKPGKLKPVGDRGGNGSGKGNQPGSGISGSGGKYSPRPRGQAARQPPTLAEQSDWSPIYYTPKSSNVYSFQYYSKPGRKNGILYVTYKAPLLNASALSRGRGNAAGVAGRHQNIGTLGKTHRSGQRPNSPGPIYGYLAPFTVFEKLVDAIPVSAGKAVWDRLRVRHSVWQHQYTVVFAGPSIHPETPGGEYIPRKATKEGFRSRTVSDGSRFGFKTSTLAPSQTNPNTYTSRKPRG